MDGNHSLCLTVNNLNNKSMYLLRIADYVNGSFVPFSGSQADFSDKKNLPYAVPTISVAPHETKVGELCVWEWEPRENEPNKQKSYKTKIPFWCLILPPETNFEVWDKSDALELLRRGFTVPENLPDSFLLKVWESPLNYRVVYLLKKDLRIFERKAKVSENVDTVKCFLISKNDFIIVDDGIKVTLQKNQTSTVFYKFAELPEDFEVLPIKTFGEQLALFFNSYAKLHNASRKERNTAKELLMDFINNKDEIIDFFTKLGYYDGKIAEKIEELKTVINAFLTENNCADQVLSAMVENIANLREKYTQYIREEWLSEKDEECIRIETDLENKARELEKVRSEYARVCEEKHLIEQTVAHLSDKRIELEKQISEFQKAFETKIIGAREEIAGFLAEVAVYQGAVGVTNSSDALIYRSVAELKNDQSDEIEEINDLLYVLEENLQKAGVMTQYKEIAAQYAACSVLSGRPLLIFGCNARAFANALSATVCAFSADILTLPVSFKNIGELKIAIDKSKSDIVLIENAVLGCDENIYLPLVKERNKKLLLFSVDFEENISLLPKSIFHFMNLIDLDVISEEIKEENYKFGQTINKLSLPRVPDDKLYHYKRILKELSKFGHLTPTYIQQRTKYLSMFDSLNGKALSTLLVCELIPYFTAQGKHEDLQRFIKEQQLPDNEQKLLEDMMV